WLAAVRLKRVTAKVSRVTAEIGTAKNYRQPVHYDQPNRERFGADARFPLFALNGSVHLLHVRLFAVIHSLANAGCRLWSFLVHSIVTFRLPAAVLALAAIVLAPALAQLI